jgi:hypothetical protein
VPSFGGSLLLLAATAFAAPPDASAPAAADSARPAPELPSVRPTAWVRPGFSWIADDPANPTAQDGFTIEARVGVDASLPRIPVSAHVEIALLPEPAATDAFVDASPHDWVTVRFGQMKVPFSLNRMASDTRRQLPRDPMFLREADISREIGLDASVRVPIAGQDRVVAWSGLYNGEGANRIQNVNQRFQLVERVLVTPFGARGRVFEGTGRELYLGIGGGWMYDFAGDGLAAEETNTFAVDLQFAWDVLSLQAEALDQEIVHANATVADYHVQGFYAQIGSFIPAPWVRDHLEIVGRLEMSDPNTAFGSADGESLAELQGTRRIQGGLNLYLRKNPANYHDIKLSAAYEHVDPLEGADSADDSFTVTALARF